MSKAKHNTVLYVIIETSVVCFIPVQTAAKQTTAHSPFSFNILVYPVVCITILNSHNNRSLNAFNKTLLILN